MRCVSRALRSCLWAAARRCKARRRIALRRRPPWPAVMGRRGRGGAAGAGSFFPLAPVAAGRWFPGRSRLPFPAARKNLTKSLFLLPNVTLLWLHAVDRNPAQKAAACAAGVCMADEPAIGLYDRRDDRSTVVVGCEAAISPAMHARRAVCKANGRFAANANLTAECRKFLLDRLRAPVAELPVINVETNLVGLLKGLSRGEKLESDAME